MRSKKIWKLIYFSFFRISLLYDNSHPTQQIKGEGGWWDEEGLLALRSSLQGKEEVQSPAGTANRIL